MTARSRATDSQRQLIDACLRLGVPFWWQGPGTLLISARGVGAVIEDVESSGMRVVGLEGFELTSPDIHPRLDLIYDARAAPGSGAAAVVADWDASVWVDVALSPETGEG